MHMCSATAGHMARDTCWRRASKSLALLACLLAVGVQCDEGTPAQPAGPVPVAEMTLMMTDGQGKQSPVTAAVMPEEDAAAAAIRFCYDKGLTQPSQVLEIVGYLKGALEGKEHEPDIELLRTAGAYSRRATESSKEESYAEAAADLVRALDRQGLDPQAKEKIERELTSTFRDIKKQRDAEEKQRKIEEEMENRRLAEEAAEEEARLRKAADDEDWANFSNDLKTKLHILKPGEPIAEGPHVLSSVQLTLHKAGQNGQKEEIPSHAQWHINEDVSHAAFRFCSTQMLHAHGEVKNVATHLRQRLSNPESAPPAHPDIASAADVVLADAKKKQDGGAYSEAGAAFARVLEKSGLPEDISQQASEGLELMLKTHQKFVEASTQYLDAAWEPAGKLIDEAMRGGGGAYNSTILLMRARCFQQRGQWADAVRATGTLLQKVDARGSWLRGQPRMMAVTLGASAAMELGDGEKALKFYQSCLRNDPDQKEISKQYKGLKNLLKLIKEVDEKLAKSQNHKALKTLEEALSGMKGMEVNSGLFRSGLQLRQCKGYSELKRHEEALLACDQSVQRRSEPVSGMFVDPKKLSEALSIRAASHMLDKNFDEAVRDLRECIDLIGQSEDFNQRMHEAQMAQRQWANQRNHREVLELPVNLHQLPKDKQCTYVKKAHKALARKWHPDKAKGNKARASRKMNEVSEAKEKLVEELGC